jgi:hypothetical protein
MLAVIIAIKAPIVSYSVVISDETLIGEMILSVPATKGIPMARAILSKFFFKRSGVLEFLRRISSEPKNEYRRNLKTPPKYNAPNIVIGIVMAIINNITEPFEETVFLFFSALSP